jgi:glycosyltransferase involved in cell wall biosynthesis
MRNHNQNSKCDIAFYGFRAGKGGISHVMLNLMHAIADEGLRVHLLLNSTDIPEVSKVRKDIEIVLLGESKGFFRILHLSRYLKEVKPEVLLCRRERANRTAVLARRSSGTSTRLAFRVGAPMESVLMKRNFIKRILRKIAIIYSYHRAEHIIANSSAVAGEVSRIARIPLSDIHVIGNPVVVPEIFKEAEGALSHPWFNDKNVPVILGAGRLASVKDFSTLIRAFSVVRKDKDVRLVILGEGKEKDKLLALAEELGIRQHVDLPGFASNPFSYYKRASLFVLSSVWEGLPNVLMEALAIGIPVVSTDCSSGPREILKDGLYGPLVPVGDCNALAAAMLKVLDSPLDKAFLQDGALRYRADICAREYIKAMNLNP